MEAGPGVVRCRIWDVIGAEGMTVVKIDQMTNEPGRKHIRAAGRVNSRVPLTAEWQADGKTLQTSGYTVDVSAHGCMAILEQELPVGQKVKVTNGATGQSWEATAIWRGHEGRKGWEMGLELESGAGDFWGLEFF